MVIFLVYWITNDVFVFLIHAEVLFFICVFNRGNCGGCNPQIKKSAVFFFSDSKIKGRANCVDSLIYTNK